MTQDDAARAFNEAMQTPDAEYQDALNFDIEAILTEFICSDHASIEAALSESFAHKSEPDRWTIGKRDFLHASEIGKSFYDAYAAMTGRPKTNPPDARAQRVFHVGRMHEALVKAALVWKCGAAKEVGVKIEFGPIRVVGSCDIVADVPIEVKSMHSHSFWRRRDSDWGFKPYVHHALQTTGYLIGLDKPYGKLFVVSKDDLACQQIVIRRADWEESWYKWINDFDSVLQSGLVPKAPDRLVFDDMDQTRTKVNANWHFTWSDWYNELLVAKRLPTDTEPKAIYDEAKRVSNRVKQLKTAEEREDFLKQVNLSTRLWYARG